MPVCDLFGDQACPEDILAETLRSGEPIIDFQTTVQLADGQRGHVLLRTAPLLDRDGVRPGHRPDPGRRDRGDRPCGSR